MRSIRHLHRTWALAALLATSSAAFAEPRSWDGGAGAGDTSWQNSLNWNPDGVPTTTSDVLFTNTAIPVFGINIPLNSAASANSITISATRAITVAGTGRSLVLTSGNFTRQDVFGTEADITINALMSIAANGVWDVNGSGALIVSNLGQTGGTRSLTKTGNGLLEIQQPSYQGGTTVNQGTLRLDGFLTGAISVASGATLQLNSPLTGFPAMTLSGTGVAGQGALRNISGDAGAGAVTLAGDGVRLSSDAGTLSLASITDGGAGFSWTKGGSGTVAILGNSSYGGDTIVDQGKLSFAGETSVGSGNIIVNPGGTLEAGLVQSHRIFLAGALSRGSIFTPLTLTGNATLNVTDPLGLTIYGPITDNSSGLGLTKSGPGGAELAGTNNFSGPLSVTGGTLIISSPLPSGIATSVQDGGTLQLKSGVSIDRPLQIAGNGAGGAGALTSADNFATNTWSGPITLTADASIGAVGLDPSVTNLVLAGPVTGPFKLTKVGIGILKLANNANSFTSLVIAEGKLQLPSPAGAPVTILSGASLSISGNAVFNDPLTLISSDITFAELASESGQNTWSGPITLQGRNQSLNVTDGRLTISGNISGGLVDMKKIGLGEAVLSGNNTYLAIGTVIQEGILTAASNAAFPPPAQPDSFDGIDVLPGATVQLKNNITIGSDKRFFLNGPGLGGVGALFNGEGNNTFAGQVRLNGDASIGAAAGSTLTLLGQITDGDPHDGDPALAITKVGSGTLVLASSANNYRGGTFINAGTLSVGSDAFLGDPAGSITCNNGGKLLITANTTSARTFNLNSGSIQVNSGVTMSYNAATISGGFLRGPGTHAIIGVANFSGVTALAGTNISQAASTTLNNFTNAGTFISSAPLTWDGGFNTAAGSLTINNATNVSGFENTGAITINGSGALNNSGNNLTSGGGGRITINPGGQLNLATTSLDLNGSLLINNGTISGATNVNFGALAKGSGVYGEVNVTDGGRFSPGNSPGSVTTASTTWSSGGSYLVEISDALAGAGSGWDTWNINGLLNLPDNGHFTISLESIDGLIFDNTTDYTWPILHASGSIWGLDSSALNLDTTAFKTPLCTGQFSLQTTSNDILVHFSPVPEPHAMAALFTGILLMKRRHRRCFLARQGEVC